MKLAISGEGFHETPAFYSGWTLRRGEFIARVDCLNTPAFWLEVTIPAADFAALSADGSGEVPEGVTVEGRSGAPMNRSRFRPEVIVEDWIAIVRVLDDFDPEFRVDVHMGRFEIARAINRRRRAGRGVKFAIEAASRPSSA